jgi:hypothetical protein
VELGLALLAGLGLTRLEAGLTRLRERRPGIPPAAVASSLLLAVAVGDLVNAQMRQNPIADAAVWMAPPVTVARIRKDPGLFRVLTPYHYTLHKSVFARARGWADLKPYIDFREFVQPNINLLWGLDAADCYAGIQPSWVEDVWGSHNRGGILAGAMTLTDKVVAIRPSLFRLLAAFNVRYVLLPLDARISELRKVASEKGAHLYRVSSVLPRAFVVRKATRVKDSDEAAQRFLGSGFDPHREILLHNEGDPPPHADPPAPPRPAAAASILRYEAREVVVEAEGPGYLVLADTWYPGWSAEVDGRPAPVFRANFNQRAVPLPSGRHQVSFRFEQPSAMIGLTISGSSIALLLFIGLLALRRGRGLTAHARPEPRSPRISG